MDIDASSPDGNAFVIMGLVSKLLRETCREAEIPAVMERMKAGNYDNLCAVAEEVTYGSIRVVRQTPDDR